MASMFKFRIFTDENPQAQYDAISQKDPMTFYLLKTGIGYLGDVKLFDATYDVADYLVTDMLADDYVGDNATMASTKAIVDLVSKRVGDLASTLDNAFFTNVKSHSLTESDLTNDLISKPENAKVGDVGLLFTVDIDNEPGGETYCFISLMDYVQVIYTFASSKSIELVTDENNQVTANLKIKNGELSLKIDSENGGVYIEKTSKINDGDGTDEGGEAPSADKLVTEEALVDYIVNSIIPSINLAIQEALEDVVMAAIDDGTE